MAVVKDIDLRKVQLDQCCDGWLPEMCKLHNFGLPFCVCDHVPVLIAGNFKFAFA